MRWEDELRQSFGQRWQSTAQNRETWRDKTKTFTENITHTKADKTN